MFQVPIWPRVNLGPHERFIGTFLVDRLLGIEVHFTAAGYMPCPRMFGSECPHHQPGGRRLIWMAPTPVWDDRHKRTKLVQITAAAASLCSGVKSRRDLYGKQLTYWRDPRTKSPVCRMLVGMGDHTDVLPGDGKSISHAQIWSYLSQYWGFDLVPSAAAGEPATADAMTAGL